MDSVHTNTKSYQSKIPYEHGISKFSTVLAKKTITFKGYSK